MTSSIKKVHPPVFEIININMLVNSDIILRERERERERERDSGLRTHA